MSSAFGKLFGKDAKAGSPVQQPTAFETLPSSVQEAFKDIIERGSRLSQQTNLFSPPSLTAEQQKALSVLEGGLAPITAEQFKEGLATFQDPFEEQVVQNALADIQRTGMGLLSDVGSRASDAGAFGGTRQALLESEIASGLAREAGNVGAQIRSQGFQQASNQALQNLVRPFDVAQILFPLADTQRQIQFGQQQAPVSALNFLSGLAAGVPVGGGQTTFSPGTPATSGALSRISTGLGGLSSGLAGLGSLAGSIGGLFSDKNLKTQIELVDNKDGINIYEYSYKWDTSKRYRGVIAQEVEKIRPDAVTTINGYLGVNYAKLGFPMEVVQ